MTAQARSIGPLFRSAVLATLVALATPPRASWASSPDPRNAPATSWDVRLGANGDPGDPFEMTGTVREEDGTIVRGRKVFVYHADNNGQYAERDGPMRYAGVLRTDNQGRYRIRTIFPGGYSGAPPHVHFEILEPGRLGGFLNVQQEGRRRSNGFTARLDRGVWRLHVDLRPGLTGPSASGILGYDSTGALLPGSGYSRPMRQLAPELWYPPKRKMSYPNDTTRSEHR